MSPRRELDGDEIRHLLVDLGKRLASRGVHASLYLVGGAAMAVEFDTRRVTGDVDAVFEPHGETIAAAREMAAELDLDLDWLNGSATAWVPGEDPGRVVLDAPGLSVAVASPEHLLAMKLVAGRPQDLSDVRLLLDRLGLSSPEAAADLAMQIYGDYAVGVGADRAELVLVARAALAG